MPTRHSPPDLVSVPVARNGGVPGSVTPIGSPIAASDGPASLNRPVSPAKSCTPRALPVKSSVARPIEPLTVKATAVVCASDALSGRVPLARSVTCTGWSR